MVEGELPASTALETPAARRHAIERYLDAPIVGRETELRRLHDALDQAARDRSCQLFTILGAAGVGKSRLVYEFLADGHATGARPLGIRPSSWMSRRPARRRS